MMASRNRPSQPAKEPAMGRKPVHTRESHAGCVEHPALELRRPHGRSGGPQHLALASVKANLLRIRRSCDRASQNVPSLIDQPSDGASATAIYAQVAAHGSGFGVAAAQKTC